MTALHTLDSKELANYAESVATPGTNDGELLLAMADRLRELATVTRDTKYPKERRPHHTNGAST